MAVLKGGSRMTAKLAEIVEKAARGKEVKVGFLEGAPGYEGGQTPAQVAFLNEFGTSHSPARPFFSTMIREKKGGWGKLLANAMKKSGMDTAIALDEAGQKIQEQLQDSIKNGNWAPNAPETIAKKGTGKAPLFDTKHMFLSVDHKVD